MPNICFYDAQISWRDIFSVSYFNDHEERCSSTLAHFSKAEKVPAKMYRSYTLFRENLQKVIADPFDNFDVSLGTTSCLLTS